MVEEGGGHPVGGEPCGGGDDCAWREPRWLGSDGSARGGVGVSEEGKGEVN